MICALTYDGATLRLYVNAALVASQAKTGAISSSTNPLQIGGDSTYGQYFNGMIDEVRIRTSRCLLPPSRPTCQPPLRLGHRLKGATQLRRALRRVCM